MVEALSHLVVLLPAAVMVLAPAVSRLAVPFLLIVATAGVDELHCISLVTSLPFTVAVNCRVELLSCRGLMGDMIVAADHGWCRKNIFD